MKLERKFDFLNFLGGIAIIVIGSGMALNTDLYQTVAVRIGAGFLLVLIGFLMLNASEKASHG